MSEDIELSNIADIAIRIITCPDKVFSPEEAAEYLSARTESEITAQSFMEFRAKFLQGMIQMDSLPVPIVKAEAITKANTIHELAAFSRLDTLGIRNGAAAEAFDLFVSARDELDTKNAISALKLLTDITDSIDKKIKALAADDPAKDVLSSKAFQSFKEVLAAIHRDYPDFDLMGKIRIYMTAQEAVCKQQEV